MLLLGHSVSPGQGEIETISSSRDHPQSDTLVVVWILALFGITALGALPLFFYRLDLSKLTFLTPIPVWAGIGIEITAYAPTLAALLVVALVPGGGGIGRLLRPVLRWRFGVSWYLLALLGPLMLFLVGDVVRLVLGLALPPHWLVIPGAAATSFLMGALIAGSFGEEVGWRGLGQPRMQERYGALWAAVAVGTVWSVWHLWPAVAPGGLNSTTWSDVVLTFVRLIATSIVYAWIYNGTQGSLLIVMLAHAGHNLAVRFVPAADSVQHGDPVVATLYVVAAILVVLVTRPRWLRPTPQIASGRI
jgi:membrane protease YdiL (CAAX protease family)